MDFVKLLPAVICVALLGAHYYRAGLVPLVIVLAVSLFALPVRERWAARIIQAELLIGGLEWVRTTVSLVMVRQSMGMPWVRLALVLGSVSAVTFGSIFIFSMKSLKSRYQLDAQDRSGNSRG